MKSAADINGRALHPMLVTLPIGGFVLTLIFDLIYMATGDPLWWDATRPVLLVSVIGGALATLPGIIDLTTVVPSGRVKRVALTHLTLNSIVLLIMAGNTWMRWDAALRDGVDTVVDPNTGFLLSLVAVGVMAVSGLLGWMMVQTYHVGVLEPGEGGRPALDARDEPGHGRTRLHDAATQP